MTTPGLFTSPDGQWVAIRRGREVVLHAGGVGEPLGQLTLPTDDADLAFVGAAFAAVIRGDTGNRVMLYEPPSLEAVARHDLEAPSRLAAVTGGRLALVGSDGKQVTIVRVAPRALAAQTLDAAGAVEFVVGLEKNQVLLALLRKLEVWDAISGRPVLRLQLQLPPAPRNVGAAQGHIWVVRPGSDEVFVYRLSDGRPFRHYAGAPISDVICHATSAVIVLVTPRGLLRLNCFAHSVQVIDAPWQPGHVLAQLVVGEDISLLGLAEGDVPPWSVPISGAGAPVAVAVAIEASDAAQLAPVKLDSSAPMKARELLRTAAMATPAQGAQPAAPIFEAPRHVPLARPDWRDALVTYGQELLRGNDAEVPAVAVDTELGDLAHRLGIVGAARRGLVALYALHLVGEPAATISRLVRAVADWAEPLGKGLLATHALLERANGTVALRRPVTDFLDGAEPRFIRVVGGAPVTPRSGAHRISRDGRSDRELEDTLAAQLGRIAVIDALDELDAGLLEAYLHGATAVALAAPPHRPRPWPRDAGLVLVLPGSASAWLADLPPLAS